MQKKSEDEFRESELMMIQKKVKVVRVLSPNFDQNHPFICRVIKYFWNKQSLAVIHCTSWVLAQNAQWTFAWLYSELILLVLRNA